MQFFNKETKQWETKYNDDLGMNSENQEQVVENKYEEKK